MPAPAVSTPVQPGLPPTTTEVLIGRDQDLGQLAALVRQRRLVTVLGAAGVGKTALARAVAGVVGAELRIVAWVELAALADSTLIASTIAQALQLPLAGTDAESALIRAVNPLEALLVLDNAEHLVDPLARLVPRLLASAPGLPPSNEPSASRTRRRVAVPSGSIVMPAWRRHARSSARSRSRGAVRGADAGGWQPVYFGRAQRWHSDRHLPAARRHGLGDQAGGGTYAAARLGGLAGRTGSKSEDTGRRNARCGGASARDVERGVQLESRATGATRTGRVPPPGCLRWRLLVAGRVHCL